MKVCCGLGLLDCDSAAELRGLLLHCAGRSMDHMWLSGEEEYPCLAILLNGERALLRYFTANGENFHSAAPDGTPGHTEFLCAGRLTPLPNRAVVSLTDAVACATEFFCRQARPAAISWMEG